MVERIGNLTKIHFLGLGYIAIMNSLSIAIRGYSISYILTYILPFIITAIIFFIFRKKEKILSDIGFFILGLIMSFIGTSGNFSGIIFILFSIYINPNRNETIIKLLLITVSVACKSLAIDVTGIQIINLLAIHYLCLGYSYVLFSDKKVITITEIEDQTEQIMNYYMSGDTIKEIAVKTCMTPAAVNKRIARLREKSNCRTVPELVAKLSILRQHDKKIDKFRVI